MCKHRHVKTARYIGRQRHNKQVMSTWKSKGTKGKYAREKPPLAYVESEGNVKYA